MEEAGGQPFLVLELAEGEDLKARLDKGAIPLDEALEIARQIAEALEEAHAHGIVHRDLKPTNVKLTPEGKVKVLDFGLAKAWAGDTGSGSSSLDLSASPTLARSGTLAGVILGTAAYMPPEQAAGKAVDKRADIWSFGVVLFEMLTGRPLFTGETASEILASVIKDEPDWDRLPEGCPPAVTRLLRRCLRKKPRDRLRDIGDALLDLEGASDAEEGGGCEQELSGYLDLERRGRSRERLALVAVAVALGGLAASLAWRDLTRSSEGRPVIHAELGVPEDLPLVGVDLAVSPDGRHVALAPWDPDLRRLWVRTLASPEVRPLPGTAGAKTPVWSPDSISLAFSVIRGEEATLHRTSLATGGVQTICRIPFSGAAIEGWNEEGVLVFSAGNPGGPWRLYSVSAAGGDPRVLTNPDPALEPVHRFAELLPDGRRFLFGIPSAKERAAGLWVSSLDRPDEQKLVLPGVYWARYAASGHLLHVRDGILLAQPFDANSAETSGEPAVVASDVATFDYLPGRLGIFSISRNGVLVCAAQGAVGSSELTWFDRTGARVGTVGEPDRFNAIQLSPDEEHVTAPLADAEGNLDVWTLDVDRGVPTRVSSDPAVDGTNVWSSDGRELFFSSTRGGTGIFRIHRKPLDDSGPPALLLDTPQNAWPESISPDGTTLVYLMGGPPTNHSVWAVSLDGPAEPELLMEADHGFDDPQVSPDGRWLAYGTNETGEWEVYVAPFRRPGPKVRVSPEGGRQSRWRGDGRELFYVTPRGQIAAVDVRSTEERLDVGLPQELVEAGIAFREFDRYAVTSDGQRFLVVTPVEEAAWSLNVILNWPSLLD